MYALQASVMGRDIDEVVWLNERDEARLGVEPFLSKSMLVHFDVHFFVGECFLFLLLLFV